MIFPEKDIVYIITAGAVAVYDHRKVYDEPDVISYMGQGDCIFNNH